MVEGGPRTFEELQGRLLEMRPDRDPAVLDYGVRMRLPPVQTPPAGTWGIGGSSRFALSEPWLGAPLADPGESYAPSSSATSRLSARRAQSTSRRGLG